MNKQYRQGDVFLEKRDELPGGLTKVDRMIVAYGEVTGHAHRFDCELGEGVQLYEDEKGALWIKVDKTSTISHEEHATLSIDPGIYEYIPQREYSPEEIRRVLD